MIEPEQIPEACAELRAEFNTEKTVSLGWRKGQLKALLTLLKEGREELCRGMNADVNRSMFEGYMTEINMVENECYHALQHLESWMSPERKNTNLFNVPSPGSYIYNDPYGVVLIMGAWNYNVVLTLGPLVGAIAGGNCVMLKPGAYAAESGLAMGRLITKYMDTSCIKLVCGNRVVNAACLEQKWDLIFFTGSPSVGKLVAHAAADHLTPIVLELGGKSPCIVDKTADLTVSVKRILHGALLNSGQTCVRPDFFLVNEEIADAFLKELKTQIINFYGKDAQKSEWYGRIINDNSFKRVMNLVEGSRDKLYYGGNSDASDKYIEPTVFDFGHDFKAFGEAPVMLEEVFGPLLPVCRYSSIEECIEFIRAGEKPLALYCFTTDATIREEVLNRTYSGGAVINDCCVHLSNGDIPFGGVGNSGMGNYHGKFSYDTFTHQKGVMHRGFMFNQMEDALRYPPYEQWNQSALGILQMPIWSYLWDKAMSAVEVKNGALLAMALYIAKLKLQKRPSRI
uniref:Aldehyde dehydrogenase n=1 Tax=Aplanochytrium stocchinoi TaxID=215587 RepID=A0A6S8A181_9STRA|mmetsp:Transcript_24427/g.29836  ORF Transcript_24427/g.29836 Transcript_24427/m.29836 type:complete len:512 (-) Transcript_24427:144-1679(-)